MLKLTIALTLLSLMVHRNVAIKVMVVFAFNVTNEINNEGFRKMNGFVALFSVRV